MPKLVCLVLSVLVALPNETLAATERFTIMSNGENVGALKVDWYGNRVEIDYRVDDNGRGPKLHEVIHLGQNGLPVDWQIIGTGHMGAPVSETYSFRGSKASWRSPSGSVSAHAPPLYIADAASLWS